MITYQQFLDELDLLLHSYQIDRSKSDIFTSALLMNAFQWGADAINGTLCSLQLVADNDPTEARFILKGNEKQAQVFWNFLAKNGGASKGVLTEPGIYTFMVKSEKLQQKILPIFRTIMRSLEKDFHAILENQRVKSYDSPYFRKQRYRKRHLMDGNLPYGKMMNEINDNLAKFGISAANTEVIINAFLKMSGSNLLFINNQRACDKADFYPVNNGESLILDVRMHDKRDIVNLERVLKQHAPTSIHTVSRNRYEPPHTLMKIKTKDFYQKLMPSFREHILQILNEPIPVLAQTYQAHSKDDPDVCAAARLPVDKSWKQVEINFADQPVIKHGFFCKLKHIMHCDWENVESHITVRPN